MLASRPSPRPEQSGSRTGGPEQLRRLAGGLPTGRRRLLLGYGVSLLAMVLGLPGLVAGLITSNNCEVRGLDCAGRLSYGLVGGIVLAVLVQLMLAVQVKLGWRFWAVSLLVMATAAYSLDSIPLVAAALVLAPAAAAWITEPPQQRRGVLGHWIPRGATLLGVLALVFVLDVVDGGPAGPGLLISRLVP